MWYLLLSIIILIIIGIIRNIFILKNNIDDYNFISIYYERFNKFIDDGFKTKNINNGDYGWIISKSDKAQEILGEIGIISYTQFDRLYNNVPLILNFVNNIISMLNEKYISENTIQFIEWCQTAFLRKLGVLDEIIDKNKKRLFNPFYNLTIGIKFILETPIYLLYSVGLLSVKGKNKIVKNIFLKIISSLISLLTIISTIMSIIIGWEKFIDIIQKLLKI